MDDETCAHLNIDINTDVVMFQRLAAVVEEKRTVLVEYFQRLSKGDIPGRLIANDKVNWIKSYSPNEHVA
ncbi:hypothetical protein [Abyssogena phaseoliformis symbiont]|uniref:hypothetical protein n=1 Tax=Abyssogena phaseoliformis symbiont TaxID=596095 RepID=UPI001915FC76|nr:hypothetical protein [Abyssogena phaseoliformis symbiont]